MGSTLRVPLFIVCSRTIRAVRAVGRGSSVAIDAQPSTEFQIDRRARRNRVDAHACALAQNAEFAALTVFYADIVGLPNTHRAARMTCPLGQVVC